MPGSSDRRFPRSPRGIRTSSRTAAALAVTPLLLAALFACEPADRAADETEAEVPEACRTEPLTDPVSPDIQDLPTGLTVHRVPWAESFAHDAVVGPDGTVWFTDMWNDCIGRLDPSTGRMEAIPMPTPGSNPHGMAVGPEGEVWYAARAISRIGRLDPATGSIREYALGSERIDPHTVLAHGDGIWFTAPQAGRYGYLYPESGVVRTHDVPPPGAAPYDLAAAPDGSLWVTLRDRLGRIDLTTGGMELVALTDSEARPSGVAVDAEGRVWYLDRSRSLLGVFDPRTSEHGAFATAGADALPRALAIGPDGRLWYFEERTRRLVSFTPPADPVGLSDTDPDAGRAAERITAFILPELPSPGIAVRTISIDGSRERLWIALGEGAALAALDLGALSTDRPDR